MALQNTTDVLDKINSTGNLTTNQKDTLRKIANDVEKIVYADDDHTVNVSTTYANHSELYFDVKAGRKYIVEMELRCLSDGTDGIKVQLNTTADPTAGRMTYTYHAAASTASVTQTDFTSATTTGLAAVVHRIVGNGFLIPSADGRFYLQTALSVDNNAATTVYKYSYFRIREVA